MLIDRGSNTYLTHSNANQFIYFLNAFFWIFFVIQSLTLQLNLQLKLETDHFFVSVQMYTKLTGDKIFFPHYIYIYIVGKNIRIYNIYISVYGATCTFFSGLSTILHSLLLICCSSSNLAVTSSMESCKRSQNPAKS